MTLPSWSFIELFPRVIYVEFENKYWAASTLIRPQEYIESSFNHIRGRYFTLEQIMDSYAYKEGAFDYFHNVYGFNLYGPQIESFLSVFGSNLSEKESKFFEQLEPYRQKYKQQGFEFRYKYRTYVVIASNKKDRDSTLPHEMAHAFYYLYEDYANKMDEMTKNWSIAKKIKKYLAEKLHYHKDVLDDELQAFVSTESPSKVCKTLKMNYKIPSGFRKLFLEYYRKIDLSKLDG